MRNGGREVPYTLVSFHAHPDDEALLTGGTLARVSAEGHRVVLVVATAGEAGLAGPAELGAGLGGVRLVELAASARALGCARVECLGYDDSGSDGSTRPGSFSAVDTAEAAARLARILIEESADVLTVYDRTGGYGHPDHVAVHHVGHAAARSAGTPVVLEATVDRDALLRIIRFARGLRLPFRMRPDAYTARADLTHRIDVRAHLAAKRAALAAHASQSTGGSSVRTLRLLLRLPRPLFRLLLGQEWFVEVGRTPGPLCGDVFDSLRARK
jgi:LmbE family N-acetylglucosaminyl deacetylase